MTNQNMPPETPIIWLNFSPALRRFDRPLLRQLSKSQAILQWDYHQTADEPNCLTVGLDLIGEYLENFHQPVHLIGHSTSGLLALLYARQCPEKVRSLSLLSVGVYPALDWQAHYYGQFDAMRYSRHLLLGQMAHHLFNCRSLRQTKTIVNILENDLLTSISPHSLYKQLVILPNHIAVPLLVAVGEADGIIDTSLFNGWQRWKKPGDRLWLCPGGKYFFQFEHPEITAFQLQQFWRSLQGQEASSSTSLLA
ncbi:alpha/beta fold hydrolase [Synechocystis sp. CACIAM 05]|uniref:alpha/beta fold hydrolase n=1 Tax=Synechocystis sp. CACIAM 05 TaxID=1933929 RepID=UPI00138E8F2B|nr:alpha/beta hydrolase [Synechocystis sp. CACIAM 05]QHV00099.1 hypothetical protein BWK47_08130 [Synechocystis sp. CACIAM 05]